MSDSRSLSARPRALGYLTHPLVVVSLVLLVLNDAVWKGAGPGWLTGKLSDFAGLAFFPGLLALVIGFVARHASTRYVGLVAWWSTALVFAAVKTVPAVNLAFIATTATVRGPLQVVLDPTDILALAVLPVGWWLWNRVTAPTSRRAVRACAGWAVATCAVLATGATQCWPPAAVHQVVVIGPAAYARVRSDVAVSTDVGRSWQRLDRGDPQIARLAEPGAARAEFPKQVCHSTNTSICYKIVDATSLAESRDGGSTWQVTWTEPASDIARRRQSQCGVGGGAESVTFATSTAPVVLVALGSEGLLRKEGDGPWERVAVLDAHLWSGHENRWQKMDGLDQLSLLFVAGMVLALVAAVVAIVVSRRRRARTPTYWLPSGAPGAVLFDPRNPYGAPGWVQIPPEPPRRTRWWQRK